MYLHLSVVRIVSETETETKTETEVEAEAEAKCGSGGFSGSGRQLIRNSMGRALILIDRSPSDPIPLQPPSLILYIFFAAAPPSRRTQILLTAPVGSQGSRIGATEPLMSASFGNRVNMNSKKKQRYLFTRILTSLRA